MKGPFRLMSILRSLAATECSIHNPHHMDIVIVVEANTPLGVSVCRKFIGLGCRVYGVGDDFSKVIFNHKFFHPVKCNLKSSTAIQEFAAYIEAQHGGILGLVFIVPELDTVPAIQTEVTIQKYLTAPALFTQRFSAIIQKQQGYIFTLAHAATSALGSLIERGLMHYMQATFNHVRNQGVRVTHFCLQGSLGESSGGLQPELIADAVDNALRFRDGNTLTQLTIAAQGAPGASLPAPLGRSVGQSDAMPLPVHMPKEPPAQATVQPMSPQTVARKRLAHPRTKGR